MIKIDFNAEGISALTKENRMYLGFACKTEIDKENNKEFIFDFENKVIKIKSKPGEFMKNYSLPFFNKELMEEFYNEYEEVLNMTKDEFLEKIDI